MTALHERYRPGHFAAVAGQDGAIKQIQAVLARGWGGRAWWIAGASGTGKTTLARIIASEGADPFFIDELDALSLTPARLTELEREMMYRAMSGRPGKAYYQGHGREFHTGREWPCSHRSYAPR